MNYLWAGMILIGIIYASFTGSLPDVTNAALDSAKEAVTLCITMLGVMSFWMGLMKIAERAGLIATFTKKLKPMLHFLFPDIPENHVANEYLATNPFLLLALFSNCLYWVIRNIYFEKNAYCVE